MWDSAIMDCLLTCNFLFGVIAVIIGALITYLLSDRIAKKQQYYIATGNFHAEFVDAVIDLKKEQQDVFKILTRAVIAQHKKAKVRFEHYIPSCKRKKFNEYWEQYETSVWTKAPGSIDNRSAECKVAIEKIESLLGHAKI